jgi:Peptidase family M28
MFRYAIRAAAPALLFLAAPLAAQGASGPITATDMMRHIIILAGDDFQGRAPATEGERRTTAYIAEQFRARGLEPAGDGGTWFQTVGLVERSPQTHHAAWTARGAAIPFDDADIVLIGREPAVHIENAPVIFAGHGVRVPERGVDQLAGVDLHGAVVLVLLHGPDVPGFPPLAARVRGIEEAGAAAVIAVVDPDVPWAQVSASYGRHTVRLQSTGAPRLAGAMPSPAVQRLIAAGGGDFARLLNDPGPSFHAVTLPLRVSIDAATTVAPYRTNNIVGRLRGSAGGSTESLLYLAHWDHLGLCQPEGAPDRICNGAVDNASGVAMMIEIAGRLATGPRPARDILFLATTSEESGLLGATYFAEHPPVPIVSIVAALNMDTVAVAPAGEAVATLGQSNAALDANVAAAAQAMGRRLDSAHEAETMARRQDGWALGRAGVPAIMVGGSFASMARLDAFLQGRYHKPDDQADGQIEMAGAVEDANLLVALGRRLADPSLYQRPQESPAE